MEKLTEKILIAIKYDCISMNAEQKSNQFHNRGGDEEEWPSYVTWKLTLKSSIYKIGQIYQEVIIFHYN